MGKSTVKECCLLDMAWPLHPWAYCSYGYLYKTWTRSSQQGQSTFQQAALIGFNGCGTGLSSKQNNRCLHQTAVSAKNMTAGTVDIPSKEEGMGRTIRPSTQDPVPPPSRVHAVLPKLHVALGSQGGTRASILRQPKRRSSIHASTDFPMLLLWGHPWSYL